MEELEKRLRSHDWFYEYSDDHSVWHRGDSARREIVALMKRLAAESAGMRLDVIALWNKYVPKDPAGDSKFSCPI